MLDVGPTPSSTMTMPVDLSPYLLSASPPGSSFDLCSLALAFSDYCSCRPLSTSDTDSRPLDRGELIDNCESLVRGDEVRTVSESEVDDDHSLKSRRNNSRGQLKPIIITHPDTDSDYSSGSSVVSEDTVNSNPCSPTSPTSPVKMRKQVSFADSYGKPLAEVRMMLEASSDPPVLSRISREEESVSVPRLKVGFSQPCADYESFDRKLQSNMVNVENVFVDEYSVQGTIFVRNSPSQKTVFVRYTVDSWETHVDAHAQFVVRLGPRDRYNFSFEVPPTADHSKSVEFAACCNADGTQFWDSNEGANFVLDWVSVELNKAETHKTDRDVKEENTNNNNNSNNNSLSGGLDSLIWWCDDNSSTCY